MYSNGHYGVSLILYSPLLALLLYFELPLLGLLGLGVILYTAPLPDIDIKQPLRSLIGHRTWTHSVWFAGLIGILTASLFGIGATLHPEYNTFTLTLFGFTMGTFGIFSHLVGDILTPTGIRPLYPVGPKYSLYLTTAKGLWWFEDTKSGNQHTLTTWERIRHAVLNSNRVFLVLGIISCGLALSVYSY